MGHLTLLPGQSKFLFKLNAARDGSRTSQVYPPTSLGVLELVGQAKAGVTSQLLAPAPLAQPAVLRQDRAMAPSFLSGDFILSCTHPLLSLLPFSPSYLKTLLTSRTPTLGRSHMVLYGQHFGDLVSEGVSRNVSILDCTRRSK